MDLAVSTPAAAAMLVTVGGAPSSAVHTLNEQKPRYICFFVSEDTRPAIREKILPNLEYAPENYVWIVTPAPQNLLECYRALAENLPRHLDMWGVSAADLGVEYTGGTKPMSVAAVLATVESSSRYFYVGARGPEGRDRGGIGVVVDGKESSWYEVNPWEIKSVNLRREIALLFNHGRFSDAQERAESLARVAPMDMRPIYQSLALLVEGYAQWDRFAYKDAQQSLGRAVRPLQAYVAGREDPIRFTLVEVESHIRFLGGLTQKGNPDAPRLDLLDLLANAERRAANAGRYDDATARLYSALEGLARNQLAKRGIKNNAVRPEQVPETIRDEYVRRHRNSDKPEEGFKIGLEDSYKLLAELGDPLGQKYLANEKDIEKVLFARNQSRLAHGSEPVERETYEKLRSFVFDFLEATPNDLPHFPNLRL